MKKRVVVMLVVFLGIICVWGGAVTHADIEDKNPLYAHSAIETLTLYGAVEVEAGYSKGFDRASASDIVLATVELGVDARINDWLVGTILFLWEEGDTEQVVLDEGGITIGGTDTCSIYLTTGKIYVPFGSYESNMVSDPLTLEIGETRESAIQIGASHGGFSGAIYVFNGSVNESGAGDDDNTDTFGVTAGYVYERGRLSIDSGIDYIRNIFDSDGLGDGFEEKQSEYQGANTNGSFELKDYIDGISAHVVVTYGPVCIIGEYVGSFDDPQYCTDDGAGTVDVINGESPSAIHLEGAFTLSAIEKEITVAATYQTTTNLSGVLPEFRYGISLNIPLADNLGLGVEYIHDEDYESDDGGTGRNAETLTLQMAMEY